MVRSVLVVDDDAEFRALAVRILVGWGHTVVAEAGTVADALRRTAELQPDLALVDVGLPDGDGFTLTRQLQFLPRPPQVVLISSDSDSTTEQEALKFGASAFFRKDELASERFRLCVQEGPR